MCIDINQDHLLTYSPSFQWLGFPLQRWNGLTTKMRCSHDCWSLQSEFLCSQYSWKVFLLIRQYVWWFWANHHTFWKHHQPFQFDYSQKVFQMIRQYGLWFWTNQTFCKIISNVRWADGFLWTIHSEKDIFILSATPLCLFISDLGGVKGLCSWLMSLSMSNYIHSPHSIKLIVPKTKSVLQVHFCLYFDPDFQLQFVSRGPTEIKSPMVQVMAWYRTGDKSLTELMMAHFIEAHMHHQVSMS